MTNPDNVGGLPELPEPVLTAYTRADGVTPFWKYDGMVMTHEGRHVGVGGNKSIHLFTADQMRAYGELCRAAPAGGDVECFVREMRTSKGAEFFVVVKRDGRELTPHMYTERWKAEYDVASWQHLLCGAPEPDLLAYGPSDVSAPAGSGEVHPIPQELFDRAHRLRELAAANRLNECLPTIETMCGKNAGDAIRDAAALLRKLQQGAE